MYKWIQWIALGLFVMTAVPIMAQQQKVDTPTNTKYEFDTPLAKFGDIEIGLGEFFYFQEKLLKEIENYQGEQRKQIIDRALQTLIFEHSIYHLAMEQGYGQTAEYASRIEDMQTGYLSAFYAYHQFNTQYAEDEDALKAMYEAEKEKYFQPAKFTFRHIFIRTVDLPEDEVKQAGENAKAALALIKAGSDFVEVAQHYSDSERKGAIVGPFNKRSHDEDSAINPALEAALMELKAGEVSEIIPTKYGYEILKLETYSDDLYRPYKQLRLTLANRHKSEMREEWKRNIVDENWETAVKEYDPGVIFNDNANPEDVIAVIYESKLTVEKYRLLRPQPLPRNPNESDEDYNERVIDQLKYDIIFNYITARLAFIEKYFEIPRYQLLVKFKEYKSVFSVWWTKMTANYMEANPITDEERQEYFEANKQYFLGPSVSKVREMTFRVPEHNTDVMYEKFKAEESAKEKAAKAIARLKAGEDFATVAKEMSESDTAEKGGDIGEIGFQTTALPKMVAREAMKLTAGKFTTEAVKDGDAYYVIQCYEQPPRAQLSIDDPSSQERIARALPSQKQSEYYQMMLNRIVNPDDIEVLLEDVYTLSPMQIIQTSLNTPEMDAEALKKEQSEKEE